MPSILPSTAASAPPATSGAKATAPSNAQDQPGSFGEALARSLEPAEGKADKPAVKAAPPALARRQPGPQKTDTDDLVNVTGLPFIPFENRAPKAGLAGGADAVADATLPATTAALLSGPDQAPTKTAAALPSAPLATGPVVDAEATGALAAATTGKDAQSAPAALRAAGSPANTAVNDGAVIKPVAMAAQASEAQAEVASAILSGPPLKRDGKDVKLLSAPGDARARLALDGDVPPRSLGKVAATPAAESPETTALALSGNSVGTDASVVASAALPAHSAAAVQTPGGAFAFNTPSVPNPVATAALAPQVGSSEWGQALGQQVAHLGTAGGQQVAELQLNPPGLGPLKVTLSMSDHQMQAMFVSAHASVRAAVEAALPQLRATLAESGISLGNTSVGAESQQQHQQQTAFSSGQGGQPERGFYRPAGVAGAATAALPARADTAPARSSSAMRIDTYA